MMHLGGATGEFKRALESDGKFAQGCEQYVRWPAAELGAQSGMTKMAGFLPEDTRVKLMEAQNEVDRAGVKLRWTARRAL